jgi:hypothetical protein
MTTGCDGPIDRSVMVAVLASVNPMLVTKNAKRPTTITKQGISMVGQVPEIRISCRRNLCRWSDLLASEKP